MPAWDDNDVIAICHSVYNTAFAMLEVYNVATV